MTAGKFCAIICLTRLILSYAKESSFASNDKSAQQDAQNKDFIVFGRNEYEHRSINSIKIPQKRPQI